jgi:phosphoribosylformimino-5-aminoimidazole carboxamide ribotide isomerase
VPSFELLPAIDLVDGRVVRLRQGDFSQATTYDDTPAGAARMFAEAGATWLHVVDLDGARAGEPLQLQLVAGLVAGVQGSAQVELGGGLRTPEAVAAALDAGATRAVVGTAALRDPAFAQAVVERHGRDRIVASIDVRQGLALGEGWREGAPGVPAADAVAMLAAAGVDTFEVTAIDRDGLLNGPDLTLLGSLVGLGLGRIIASGGVSSLDDVLAARSIGCSGAIVGRALYEGRVDLAALVDALRTPVED